LDRDRGGGFVLALKRGEQRAEAFEGVVRHGGEFFDELPLELKTRERILNLAVDRFVLRQQVVGSVGGLLGRGMPGGEGFVSLRVELANGGGQARHVFEMLVFALDFAIGDDAIKALLRRRRQQSIGHGEMFLRGKPEVVKNLNHFVFRLFNPPADFHFLFGGKQRYRPHLL